jgi:hypothetical protein
MIECLRYISINKGTLLGYADLWVEKMGIEIFGCSLHQKDGRRWVNLPSREYKDKNGETKYQSIIRFRNKSFYERFCKKAKEAIEKKCTEEVKEPQQNICYDEECPF